VKQSIIELQPMYKFMQKSLTKIDIKDWYERPKGYSIILWKKNIR
jgi:hypothetical protein